MQYVRHWQTTSATFTRRGLMSGSGPISDISACPEEVRPLIQLSQPCGADMAAGNDARTSAVGEPPVPDYGTTARKRNTAKITKCTMPWSTVVRPVPKVITPTSSVIASRTCSSASSPSTSG